MTPRKDHPRSRPLAAAAWVLWLTLFSLSLLAWPPLSRGAPAFLTNAPSANQTGQPVAIPASRLAEHIAVLPIASKLDRFAAASIMRRIETAQRLGANAIVLEIDSRESDFGALTEMLAALRASPIANTTAWVKRDALGGAALLALSCREIVTSESGMLGESVDADWLKARGRTRPRGPGNPNPALAPSTDLIASGLATAIESARRFDRDEFLAQALTISGVELWLVEEVGTGRRIFMNELEYRMLFKGEPPRTKATLAPGVSTPGLPMGSSSFPSSILVSASPAIIPASPIADAVLASQPQGTLAIETASHRPTFSAADAGRWTLVEYAASGAGAATLRGAQMVDYGVAESVVRTPEELSAYFGAKKVTILEESWAERVARGLSHPFLRGLLVTVFLVAFFIEMSHPGLVLPGIIGSIALMLLLGPALAIGLASWWSLIAIGIGGVLIAIEIFVIPGFGVTGILGLLLLLTGLVFTFIPTGPAGLALSSPDTQDALFRGLVTVLLSTVTAIFAIFFVIRQLGTIPFLEKLALRSPAPGEVDDGLFAAIPNDQDLLMVGDEGIAETPLRPAGKARFGEDLVEVVAESGYIPAGAIIRILATDKFKTAVELVEFPPAAPDPTDPTDPTQPPTA